MRDRRTVTRLLLLVALAGMLALAGCASTPPPPVPVPTFGAADPPVAPPTRIEIPAIGAAGDLVALGLNPDGTLAVPPVTTPGVPSWYKLGPRPGQIGPAVVAGHVDGGGQPGIFADLDQLAPGDPVLIDRADGTRVTFTVTGVEQYPKDQFPTGKVYGDSARPELKLITCGGSFDEAADSYRDNIVATAVLE